LPSRDTTVEICAVEHEVVVEFDIKSCGTPDSYFEPGDPPEVEITAVYYKDEEDDDSPRDISVVLSELRDLELRQHWGQTAYGYGFKVQHGHRGGDPLRPETQWRSPPNVTFNEGRSVLDSLEAEIYENFHEYDTCDEPEDWHD
jgi:hypothetical protein